VNDHDDVHDQRERFMKYVPVMEQLVNFIPQHDPAADLCLLFKQP
jgi:hypothetical protein